VTTAAAQVSAVVPRLTMLQICIRLVGCTEVNCRIDWASWQGFIVVIIAKQTRRCQPYDSAKVFQASQIAHRTLQHYRGNAYLTVVVMREFWLA
jgi:hypothetical protein